MARRAILEAGTTEVVKRGWLAGQNARSGGMAFQAEQVLLAAHEHLRIHRTMGFVTTHAPLQAHSSMLKGKGSALVGMALGAGNFVPAGSFHLPGIQPSVGRVAVDAVDRALLQAMPEGLGKGRLRFFMARDAKLIGFLCQQVERLFRLMDAVTLGAGQLIFSVQTCWTASVSFRLRMAGEAVLTDFPGRYLRKSDDLRTISCINVRLPGSVARLAALVLPAFFLARLKNLVWVVGERPGEILVTGTTRGRTDELVLLRGTSRFLRAARSSCKSCTREPSQEQYEPDGLPDKEFAHGQSLGTPLPTSVQIRQVQPP